MKSIRLSLIVNFLLLLAAALGAVSWLAYQSSAQTLQGKVESQRLFLEAEFTARCQEARTALDRRILQQAQTLAGLTRSTFLHLEGVSPIGLLSTATFPQGHLAVPLWLSETFHSPLALRMLRLQPLTFFIESAEDVMPAEEEGRPREFFQTYRPSGQPLQRSASLGDSWFSLDDKVRGGAHLFQEHFDTVKMADGLTVRRVSLKVTVPRFRAGPLPPWWRFLKPSGKSSRPPGPFFAPPPPPGTFFGIRPSETEVPVIFMQYASDTAPLEATLAEFQAKHENDLHQLEEDSARTLAALRQRLLVIGLATFSATVAGGLWLIGLGLVPLRRLSEAVSQVSARDFQLPIDQEKLPQELQPIAHRLVQTLQLLQRAFNREKQAAADISHELRTPLAALLTTIDLALRKLRTPEEYRQFFVDCRASGQHMNQLVERLLALARLDAAADRMQIQDVDVADLANRCADMVRPLAQEKGLDLRVQASRPTLLPADPDKLREVVNNLLHNAIEYNRPSGSIDLVVQRDNGSVRLEVRDTGIGIAPEDRERIFERFFRADPSRQAEGLHAGLGLAIVKGYIDLMGGTIGVDSSDKGTIFVVHLPIPEGRYTARGYE